MLRAVTLATLFLAALVVTAAAQKDKDKPKEAVYKTPQEVADAVFTALDKRDFRTFVNCLSPDAQKEEAGLLALEGLRLRMAVTKKGREKLKEQSRKALEVLDKHGLTEKATRDINTADRDAAIPALTKLIKEPAAFVVDFMTAEPKRGGEDDKAPSPTLKDVKIDGDKATGAMVIKLGEKEIKDLIAFVKVGGSWKLAPRASADAWRVYETPKEVYEDYVEAHADRRFKVFVACIDPEALKVLAVDLFREGNDLRDYAEGRAPRDKDKDARDMEKERAERLRPVSAALDKHGLTVKATKGIDIDSRMIKERVKARLSLLALVKDVPAFCADYLTAIQRAESFRHYAPRRGAKLADLKIDGDKATGNAAVVEREKDGAKRENKKPIAFVKSKGSWRVIPNPEKKFDSPYSRSDKD